MIITNLIIRGKLIMELLYHLMKGKYLWLVGMKRLGICTACYYLLVKFSLYNGSILRVENCSNFIFSL